MENISKLSMRVKVLERKVQLLANHTDFDFDGTIKIEDFKDADESVKESILEFNEFHEICKPVVQYMQKKGLGSETIIITADSAKIVNDEKGTYYELPENW